MFHCFRLNPNQDLKSEILRYCVLHNIAAGAVISAVGSLSKSHLRLAGSGEFFEATEKFEIVSATGSVSKNGCHLHISIADARGRVIGGHLVEGNMIFTTCELVIAVIPGIEFTREHDALTGYNELQIKKTT